MKKTEKSQTKLAWFDLASPKKDDTNKKRVVQTESGEKTKAPQSDAFLAWQNQTVDRETVSKNRNTTLGGRTKNIPTQVKPAAESELKHLSKLGVPLVPTKTAKDYDQPDWATPGTRAEDFIRGMKESDRTALNTREYVFYTYFQRIRERLDHAWVPLLRQRLVAYYNSGRHLASDMEHTTKVLVVLNGKGDIVRVQMISESDTRDLDESAVDAFNKAGPFPNPPSGMIDVNGEIRVPWDFILKS